MWAVGETVTGMVGAAKCAGGVQMGKGEQGEGDSVYWTECTEK